MTKRQLRHSLRSQQYAAQNIDVPNIAFGPKSVANAWDDVLLVMLTGNVDRCIAAPVNSDYLYISRDACRTNHDRVLWIVI